MICSQYHCAPYYCTVSSVSDAFKYRNVIGFGTWRLEGTIFVRVIYLFIMKIVQYSDKKEKTTLTVTVTVTEALVLHPLLETEDASQSQSVSRLTVMQWRARTPEGHFVLFAGHSSKRGVLGNVHSNGCIITFPCYRSTLKRRTLLS